jgi:DNA invertase Pin-like site-specific DNA recombinase
MSQAKQAVIYARTATSQERGPNAAMQEQVRQGLEHARLHGYEVVGRYEEVASGLSLERPMLAVLTEAAKAGKFTVLIVCAIDRISRNMAQVALFFHTMEECGVTIESVVEAMEGVPPDAVFQSIYQFVRQAERDMLARRTRQGRSKPSQMPAPQEPSA